VSPRDALTYAVGAVGLLLLAACLVAGAALLWALWGIYALLG